MPLDEIDKFVATCQQVEQVLAVYNIISSPPCNSVS